MFVLTPSEACARTDKADLSIGKAKSVLCKIRLICEAKREINKLAKRLIPNRASSAQSEASPGGAVAATDRGDSCRIVFHLRAGAGDSVRSFLGPLQRRFWVRDAMNHPVPQALGIL